MSQAMTISILMTIIGAATPLLLAALGELVAEKSGVLNLGVEGMMLIGAVSGFAVTSVTGVSLLGLLVAMLAATAASLIFGYLTLTLASNQVATGLALTIFGIGLSSMLGEHYVGTTIPPLGPVFPEALASHPLLRLVFGHSILVYVSLAMTALVAWFLKRSRGGLILRAVGENDHSAHSIGYSVIAVRYAAVAFGGAMAGLAGCYYSMVQTPMWAEELTAGRGWIALALVVFAAWRPLRVLVGAYLFGGVTILQLHAQGGSMIDIPSQYLSMLPYIATIVVLTLMSSGAVRRRLQAPACLGRPFHPTA
jgi:simple sugar transport system permease protein